MRSFIRGGDWFEDWGRRLRRLTGRRVPMVATLEGLLGGADREREYSEWAKHPVYCQAVDIKMATGCGCALSTCGSYYCDQPLFGRDGASPLW